MNKYQQKDGFAAEILEEKGVLLKKKVDLTNNQEFKNELAAIEFAVNVHVIFIARFLNKNARLVLTQERCVRDSYNGKIVMDLNVDDEIKKMERCLQYFELWKDWSKDQSKNTDEWNVKKRDQLFIAGLTLKNLKICLSGFLYYAKEVLSTSSAISFIPYLHANQSSLESIFSVHIM